MLNTRHTQQGRPGDLYRHIDTYTTIHIKYIWRYIHNYNRTSSGQVENRPGDCGALFLTAAAGTSSQQVSRSRFSHNKRHHHHCHHDIITIVIIIIIHHRHQNFITIVIVVTIINITSQSVSRSRFSTSESTAQQTSSSSSPLKRQHQHCLQQYCIMTKNQSKLPAPRLCWTLLAGIFYRTNFHP